MIPLVFNDCFVLRARPGCPSAAEIKPGTIRA